MTSPTLAVVRLVTALGAVPVVLGIAAVVTAVLVTRRRWRALRAWLVGLAGTGASVGALKLAVRRVRPPTAVPGLGDSQWSFPSGHAALAAVTYGLLAYWAVRAARTGAGRVAAGAGFAVLIAAIAASRIALGMHYLSDVLGGLAVGGLWAGIAGGRLARPEPSVRDGALRSAGAAGVTPP